MSDYEVKGSKAGLTFMDALALVFIVLKLCKVINWSWVWVLSPIWIQLAFLAVILVIFVIKTRH